jgi:hypothetical protein
MNQPRGLLFGGKKVAHAELNRERELEVAHLSVLEIFPNGHFGKRLARFSSQLDLNVFEVGGELTLPIKTFAQGPNLERHPREHIEHSSAGHGRAVGAPVFRGNRGQRSCQLILRCNRRRLCGSQFERAFVFNHVLPSPIRRNLL